MRPFSKTTTRSKIVTAIRGATAALLCVAALCQPHFAYAARGGGGAFLDGRGFHAGALHAGGLHGGGLHGGFSSYALRRFTAFYRSLPQWRAIELILMSHERCRTLE